MNQCQGPSRYKYLTDAVSKIAEQAEPEWLARLERTICHTLNPGFESYQYLYVYKYVDQKGSTAMLAMRPAYVAPEENLRNSLWL